jgi:hypothetical protein
MSACASGRDDTPLVMHAPGGISGLAVGRRVFIGLAGDPELVTESYRMLAPKKLSALLD